MRWTDDEVDGWSRKRDAALKAVELFAADVEHWCPDNYPPLSDLRGKGLGLLVRTERPVPRRRPALPRQPGAAVTTYSEVTADRKRTGFRPPTGPGRCPACGWHTPTQSHPAGCPGKARKTTYSPLPTTPGHHE